ncbi:predicted protein, partial [Nematostella vectensis]
LRIPGWLKAINDVDNIGTDLFAFKISYDDPTNTAKALFNGNIAETYWKTSSDNKLRKYEYTYDGLNRLLQADYSKNGNATFNSYLEHLTYDKNGNIQSLLRNGAMDTDGIQFAQTIDNLTYTYDTNNKNQLVKVDDSSNSPQGFNDGMNTDNDFFYDANGNMIKDNNKGITGIQYNHLNLPTKIVVGTNRIEYIYNATGQKVIKKVNENNTNINTYYLSGGFQYEEIITSTTSQMPQLKFFPHAEGYVNVEQGRSTSYFNYVFNYTDHLGNIRLSYAYDPSIQTTKIIEENHYYAFGLKHTGYNSDLLLWMEDIVTDKMSLRKMFTPKSSGYQYKYNGKELQTELGQNVYAYGWRDYGPAIGSFNKMDRFSETYFSITPYNYAGNSPVAFNEIKGDSILIFSSQDNAYILYENGKLYSRNRDFLKKDVFILDSRVLVLFLMMERLLIHDSFNLLES